MAKSRRYSETIQIYRETSTRDETGGAVVVEALLQECLAEVRDEVRARVDNLDTFVQLNNAIAFRFYKPDTYELGPDISVKWRGHKLVLQYFKVLPNVKQVEIVCVYGTKEV